MKVNPWKLLRALAKTASAVLRLTGKGEVANVVNAAEASIENVVGSDQNGGDDAA